MQIDLSSIDGSPPPPKKTEVTVTGNDAASVLYMEAHTHLVRLRHGGGLGARYLDRGPACVDLGEGREPAFQINVWQNSQGSPGERERGCRDQAAL